MQRPSRFSLLPKQGDDKVAAIEAQHSSCGAVSDLAGRDGSGNGDFERDAAHPSMPDRLLPSPVTLTFPGDGAEAKVRGEKQQTRQAADAAQKDPNLVILDAPGENPRNWTYRRRYLVAVFVAMYTFLSPIASSAIAPALPKIAHDLHVDGGTETNLLMSLFILAFAFGPLLWSPLSEVYGRRNVLQSTNLIFLVFNLSCGFTKTQAQYCIMRFLAGLFGSAPLAIGGGVISDMFEPHDRGRAISWYSLAPMLAPCVGPITSGWIVEKNVSWRWIHWMWTAFGALVASIGLIVLAETYQPRLLELKRNRLAKETGNHALFTEYTFKSLSPKQRIAKALVRPVLMLSSEIILLLIALAMLFVYGLLYLVLATFTVVFERSYNESVGIAGINYVSLALGYTAGGQIGGRLMDKIYLYLRARNGGESVPEHKLPLSLSGGLFLVVGMIIYGWAAEKHFHWIVPNIGAFLFAFGNIQCFLSFMNYIIDSYGIFAASGMAAAVFLRSLAGFGFPLFAGQLYDSLGYGWGNTTLALVYCAIGIPSSALFMRWGSYLRSKSPYQSGRKAL